MFKNVGKDIKGYAKWVFYVHLFIAGYYLITTFVNMEHPTALSVITPIITALFICGAGWLESVLLYGFGIIVEDHENNSNPVYPSQPVRPIAPPAVQTVSSEQPAKSPTVTSSTAAPAAPAAPPIQRKINPNEPWTCPSCGMVNDIKAYSCKNCRRLKPITDFKS